MREQEIKQIFRNHSIFTGRMLGASKSRYREAFPDSEAYFNANIFSRKFGKIWWGDLDLTIDSEALQSIADELGDDLFVLSEMDGRFENEDLPFEEFKKRAVKFYLTSK
jgi:hypothetical protein